MNWHEDPKELARRRREAGLSQAELAKRTHRSRSVIRDVELGRIKLRGELAHSLWTAIARADTDKAKQENRLGNLVRYKDVLDHPEKYAESLQQFQHPTPTQGAGNLVPLGSGLDKGRDTRERVMEKLIEAQQSLINTLREIVDLHKDSGSEKDKRIAELEERVALLSDLLNVETTKGLAQSEAEELREKLSTREEK